MSLATKPTPTLQRRIWKAPASRAKWYWLIASTVIYAVILGWYIYTLKTQKTPEPIDDPLRLFGIIAYSLVLLTAAYSLRRRFVRGLPGMVQNWLWMHTWIGIGAILIAMLHENFAYITHDFFEEGLASFTGSYWGPAALYALIFLVLSGIIGRFLDTWQTKIIAFEASTNGVGITRALEERIVELEYGVERLCAGKSENFKAYCLHAIEHKERGKQQALPKLPSPEHADFTRAQEILQQRAELVASRDRQIRAQRTMSRWRKIHIILASLSLLVISYHAVMQLLVNVFQIIKGE